MPNELAEILAIEERWVSHGGPMTFMEFEAWEWEMVLTEAYAEDVWRRILANPPDLSLTGWGQTVRFSSAAPTGYWLPDETYVPGHIVRLAPGEQYIALPRGTDSTGPR